MNKTIITAATALTMLTACGQEAGPVETKANSSPSNTQGTEKIKNEESEFLNSRRDPSLDLVPIVVKFRDGESNVTLGKWAERKGDVLRMQGAVEVTSGIKGPIEVKLPMSKNKAEPGALLEVGVSLIGALKNKAVELEPATKVDENGTQTVRLTIRDVEELNKRPQAVGGLIDIHLYDSTKSALSLELLMFFLPQGTASQNK